MPKKTEATKGSKAGVIKKTVQKASNPKKKTQSDAATENWCGLYLGCRGAVGPNKVTVYVIACPKNGWVSVASEADSTIFDIPMEDLKKATGERTPEIAEAEQRVAHAEKSLCDATDAFNKMTEAKLE